MEDVSIFEHGYGFQVTQRAYLVQLRHEDMPGTNWNWYYTTGTLLEQPSGYKHCFIGSDPEEVCIWIKNRIYETSIQAHVHTPGFEELGRRESTDDYPDEQVAGE